MLGPRLFCFVFLYCNFMSLAVHAACMGAWSNDFIIGKELGETYESRKSQNGKVVKLEGYIYYFGELMPTKRNKCGELLFTPVFVNDSGEYVHIGFNRRQFRKFDKCVFAPFKFGHYGKQGLWVSRTTGMAQKIKWGLFHKPWKNQDRLKHCKVSLQGRYVFREHVLAGNPKYTFKGEAKEENFVLDFFRPSKYRLYLDVIRIYDLYN